MSDRSDPDAPDDDHLDGCALDFDSDEDRTDDDQADSVVMFADCWDDPEAVEQRRAELVEWDAATRGGA